MHGSAKGSVSSATQGWDGDDGPCLAVEDGNNDNGTRALKRYLRKVDFRIVLYCAIGYVLCMMDRTNIGSAKISGLDTDLKLSDTVYSLALSIFYVGYLLMQLCTNIVLKTLGPSKWIPFMGTAWGTVCACLAATKNGGGLVAARFFLGLFEAGITPGVVYMISFWYPRDMAARRMSAFFMSAAAATVISGPLAAGLTSISTDKVKGWQWLFIIEGLITVLWGISGLFILKDYPEKARFLRDDERAVIEKVLVAEHNLASHARVTTKGIIRALKDWKTWLWGAMCFSGVFPINTNALFAPSIIKDMGYRAMVAQLMTAIPSLCGALGMVLSFYLPKYLRGLALTKVLYALCTVSGSLVMIFVTNDGVKLFGLCLMCFGGYGHLSIDPGWFMGCTGGVIKRGVVSGAIVCCGGFSGFAVSYAYPGRDAPRYVMGHSINLALSSFLVTATLFLRWWYKRANKLRDHNHQLGVSCFNEAGDEAKEEERCDDHPDFRYIY